MRPQIHFRGVVAWISLYLLDSHFRSSQWFAGLRAFGRMSGVSIDVIHDPFLKPDLHVGALLERANLIAHDALQVMRKSATREKIWKTRRQVGVRCGVRIVVLEGLLQ